MAKGRVAAQPLRLHLAEMLDVADSHRQFGQVHHADSVPNAIVTRIMPRRRSRREADPRASRASRLKLMLHRSIWRS